MNQGVDSIRIIVASLLCMVFSACDRSAVESELPPHEISYQSEMLKGSKIGSKRVIELKDINMQEYTHLILRKEITLYRAIYEFVGADAKGFLVAVQNDSKQGFAVKPLSSEQGKFLFAPIESGAEALEYVKLMVHETPESDYGRDRTYIHDMKDFETTLEKMKEEASHFDEAKVEIVKTPPTKITRVTEESPGKYLVELVFKAALYQHRIEYLACLVQEDGSLSLRDSYVFVKGPPGLLL